MHRFVVTGCGRSGTRYVARLLTNLGAACSHEKAFGPNHHNVSWKMPPYGDSSSFAVPFLGLLPDNTVVLHVIRNPINWLKSSLFATLKGQQKTSRDFHIRHMRPLGIKEFDFRDNPKMYMIETWVKRNKIVESTELPYYCFQLESLRKISCVQKLLERIGHDCPINQISQTLKRIPRNINTRGNTDCIPIDVNSIGNHKLCGEMKQMALRWGYVL